MLQDSTIPLLLGSRRAVDVIRKFKSEEREDRACCAVALDDQVLRRQGVWQPCERRQIHAGRFTF